MALTAGTIEYVFDGRHDVDAGTISVVFDRKALADPRLDALSEADRRFAVEELAHTFDDSIESRSEPKIRLDLVDSVVQRSVTIAEERPQAARECFERPLQ